MRIDNRTKWSTDDLRVMIAACLRSRGVQSTGLRVVVATARRRISGRATLGKWVPYLGGGGKKRLRHGRWMRLNLPSPMNATNHESLRLHFAQVIDHEVAHLAGLDHAHMSEKLYRCEQDVTWLGTLPLGVAAERAEKPDEGEHRAGPRPADGVGAQAGDGAEEGRALEEGAHESRGRALAEGARGGGHPEGDAEGGLVRDPRGGP